MKKISLWGIAGLLALIVIGLTFSCFTVQEGERGLLARQNGLVVLKPGLHCKWPWESVNFIVVNSQNSDFAVPLPAGGESLQLGVVWNVSDINTYAQNNQSSDQVLQLLKTEAAKILTPNFLASTNSPGALGVGILQGLQNDTVLQKNGIAVSQVWIKGFAPDDATQTKIFSNMKGLATTIGQTILASGEAEAEQIRDTAEQNFLQAQNAALQEAATILGQGNSAAVKIMAPLYHQNPALFKAYVAAKVKLLASESGS